MAVELTDTSASFVGTGISSMYAAPIYASAASQVRVTVDGILKVIGDDYVLNNLGSASGINIVAEFPSGSDVYLERLTAITQPVDTQNNETILEDVIDSGFDRSIMIDQEQQTQLDRALLAPKGQTGATFDFTGIGDGELLQYKDGALTRVPKTPFAGKVYGGDATGAVTPVTQGGADAALRTDIAQITGTALIGHRGRTLAARLGDMISVLDYGVVVGDPSAAAANLAALNVLKADLAGGNTARKVLFPAGEIFISAVWTLALTNVIFIGAPGLSKITNATTRAGIRLDEGASNLVFQDIWFNVAVVGGSSTTSACVYSTNTNISNIDFIRCKFSAPNTTINGVKIVADTSFVSNIRFLDCIAEDIGRMGYEVQAHADTIYRYKNIIIEGGYVKNTNLQGVSLSGWGEQCEVGRRMLFDNTGFCAIENVGCSRSRFTGTYKNLPSAILSFTGSRSMFYNEIFSLKPASDGAAGTGLSGSAGSSTLRNQRNLTMQDNYLLISSGQFYLKNVQNSRFARDYYVTNSSVGLAIEGGLDGGAELGPTTGNRFDDVRLDNSARTSSQFAAVRFDGSTVATDRYCVDNLLRNFSIVSGTGGNTIDNIDGATENYLQTANAVQNIAFGSDADTDVSSDSQAPLRYGRLGFTISGTITAARTITLPANMRPVGGNAPFKNNCAFGVNLKVGATTVGPIAAGATAQVYFPTGSIGLL